MHFPTTNAGCLIEMLDRGVRSPRTTSAGRLFDAVASILGLRQVCRFEGQAAMELEFLTHEVATDDAYPFDLVNGENGRQPRLGANDSRDRGRHSRPE